MTHTCERASERGRANEHECRLMMACIWHCYHHNAAIYYLIWRYWMNKCATIYISLTLTNEMTLTTKTENDVCRQCADSDSFKFIERRSKRIHLCINIHFCCNCKWKLTNKEKRQINIPNKLTRFQLYLQICIFCMQWRQPMHWHRFFPTNALAHAQTTQNPFRSAIERTKHYQWYDIIE